MKKQASELIHYIVSLYHIKDLELELQGGQAASLYLFSCMLLNLFLPRYSWCEMDSYNCTTTEGFLEDLEKRTGT